MGLLSIIRKIKRKEKEMRILMVGLDNSGKTTIVLKINGEDTSVISPTLGFNIKTIKYQKYSLNIWDVGGQKTIRSYWRNYFEQTDGLVWVVDSSDIRRLDDCRAELHNLLKEERLAGASLLVFANKQDIQGALKPEEIAKVLDLEVMEKSRHWQIVGCSAYTGDGLLQGFDWLVQDIASRIYVHFLGYPSRMGLLSIIRKFNRKEKEMRFLMVGLDNSGKTTIVLKINGEDTSVISPILGFNIKIIKYQNCTRWDVGGQKTIRSYWKNYFEQTDGLVWAADSSDIRRLDDCRAELQSLLKEELSLDLEVMNKSRHLSLAC
ncbi:hypothetical protein ACP70R_045499 [Stipagrostis hirtigluma subsp. patula]